MHIYVAQSDQNVVSVAAGSEGSETGGHMRQNALAASACVPRSGAGIVCVTFPYVRIFRAIDLN
jgi:hypothetical protein